MPERKSLIEVHVQYMWFRSMQAPQVDTTLDLSQKAEKGMSIERSGSLVMAFSAFWAWKKWSAVGLGAALPGCSPLGPDARIDWEKNNNYGIVHLPVQSQPQSVEFGPQEGDEARR